MKYLLLIYQNPTAAQAMPAEDKERFMADADALVTELAESGEWVGGEGLADPATAKTARPHEGAVAVTDGPFAEAKEQIVGYCIIDCESMDRAADVARRWPDARLWGVEVRPILSPDGVEM